MSGDRAMHAEVYNSNSLFEGLPPALVFVVTVFKLAEPFNDLIYSLDPQQAYRCCMTVMNTPWA